MLYLGPFEDAISNFELHSRTRFCYFLLSCVSANQECCVHRCFDLLSVSATLLVRPCSYLSEKEGGDQDASFVVGCGDERMVMMVMAAVTRAAVVIIMMMLMTVLLVMMTTILMIMLMVVMIIVIMARTVMGSG